MSSLLNPQLVPSEHCYTIIQDHGPMMGGWGPANIEIPGLQTSPVVYTGSDELTIAGLRELAEKLAQDTGKPTRLVRFSSREDLATFGESHDVFH